MIKKILNQPKLVIFRSFEDIDNSIDLGLSSYCRSNFLVIDNKERIYLISAEKSKKYGLESAHFVRIHNYNDFNDYFSSRIFSIGYYIEISMKDKFHKFGKYYVIQPNLYKLVENKLFMFSFESIFPVFCLFVTLGIFFILIKYIFI